MPTVKLHLSIGFAGANREDTEDIDDELWKTLSEKEREALLDEITQDWAYNYIEYNAHVVE